MKHIRLLVILGIVCAVLATPYIVYIARSPVLIVTDAPFAALYGVKHLRQQRNSASFTLFRQVKPVRVADGVSPDVVIYAITEASSRPFCVLFARNQAMGALRFHEQFPEIPVVVLRGLVETPELPPPDGFLCIYAVDREVDLYRAGLFAGILGKMKQEPALQAENQGASAAKSYILWQERSADTAGRELFTRGVRENDPETHIVFVNSIAGAPDPKVVSCAVLTGAGAEYLEKNPRIPVVLFSWLDPLLTALEVAVQFDDSAWALAVPAARMAALRQAEGKIPSKPLIFPRKIADNNIFRMLKESAKKMP